MSIDPRNDDGAVLVEMALVTLLLVLLVSGVVDIGRAYFTSISLREATQEGTLYASYHPTDTAGIKNRTIQSVDDITLAVGDITVTCPGGDFVSVTVDHDLDLITPIGIWFGGAFGLSSTETGTIFTGEACTAG